MKEKQKMKAEVVFRHFSRGGYAVFASLHREVRIGVLAVGMLTSVNIPKVQAVQVLAEPTADEDGDETELAEVSVAGSMAPLAALQSARLVSVITAQQIESSAAQSVNDLLKLVVGVDVRQRGGFGIQSDISIDGGTFDQITLLLNGVNITSPHTGHLAADFPVNLSDIERIEVLEGAASRVYGASAFGGAINIVTKSLSGSTANSTRVGGEASSGEASVGKPKPMSFDAGLQGGSYATLGADARFSIHSAPSLVASVNGASAGTICSSLSASYQRSDGATVNSEFRRCNLYWRGCYDSRDFRIDCQAGYSQKSYGANTFYSAAYPNQYERNRRFIVSAGAETKGRIRVRPEVFWNRLLDHFELTRGRSAGENFHQSDVYGTRVHADVSWAAGRSAIGAEVREEQIHSTNLGRLVNSALAKKVPGESLYYGRYDSRTNLSFNLEHNILLERLTVSMGILANYNTRFSQGLRFYPGIDIAFTPAAHWRLFAGYNKGFRLPTFTDLYYKSPTHEGNPDMKAEESHSFQLGTSYRTQAFDLSLKGFYHHGKHLIDWVMFTPTDVFHSYNFDLDNLGVQVQGFVRFNQLFCSERFPLQCLTVGYTFIHQRRRDDVAFYKSNYAMEYLRHKLVATLDHRIVGRLKASWSLRWQDRMGSYLRYENAKSTGELVDYKPYATLDVKFRWQAPCFELWAEATNLTNHTYYDLGNIPQPGLVVMGGARLHF